MNKTYEVLSKNDFKFELFISGPSKTADIEQSLVYGAHGAKEMEIIII